MKTFRIYRHPIHGLLAVKAGFSWPAFLFGSLWMLFKKLWMNAAIWIAAHFALGFLSLAPLPESDTNALLAAFTLIIAYSYLWLVPGFKGNEWLETDLIKRGFKQIDSVSSETPDAALAMNAIATQRSGQAV